MPSPKPHPQEALRLECVRATQLLNTETEERFDQITRMASRMFGVRFAMFTLIGDLTVWVKSGVNANVGSYQRDFSYCAHAILDDVEICIIPDARLDPRTFDNVHNEVFVFYAAVMVRFQGQPVGVFCISDTSPRELTPVEVDQLVTLGKMTEAELMSVLPKMLGTP